jgi:hypothetical protein
MCQPNRACVTTPRLDRRPSLACRGITRSSISRGVKSRRLVPGWKVLGRRGVLLDERGGRQYRPQPLAGVDGVCGRVHLHLPVVVPQREQVRLALEDLRASVEAERVLP